MSFGSNNTSSIQGNNSSAVSTACFVNDPFSVKLGRIIAYSVVILLSLAGNICIIVIIRRYGRARKTVNYAVVNMAAASIIITTTYMPRLIPMYLIGSEWLVHGNAGYVLCKIVPFLHGVAILASVLTLLASNLDTFFAVAFPLKKLFTPKVAKFAIFLTWAFAAAARLPYLIALRTRISKGKHVCSSRLNYAFNNENVREIYYTFLLITFYALPWLAIFIINSTIAIILKMGKTPRQERMTAVRLNKARGKATRNVVKMMLIITFVFLGCWIIYFLAQVAFKLEVPCSFRFWRFFLAHCNCAINPVLFAIFNTTVRTGIKDIVRKIRGSPKKFHFCSGSLERIFARNAMKRGKFYISPRRPTAFSIAESFNLTNLSQINRKLRASGRRVGAVELGIINEGLGRQNNTTFKTSILSFNTLKY